MPTDLSRRQGKITQLRRPEKLPDGSPTREFRIYGNTFRLCDFTHIYRGETKIPLSKLQEADVDKYEVEVMYSEEDKDSDGVITVTKLTILIEVIGKEIVFGGPVMKGHVVKTLKGRVWAQWADNPDGEILFGIQYWNTGEPASGNPSGRSSTALDLRPPDPLFVCCAWGFTGGIEDNKTYAGWYQAQTTVRLKVKDKALMDRIIKATQELVALEVTLDGRTITSFRVLEKD